MLDLWIGQCQRFFLRRSAEDSIAPARRLYTFALPRISDNRDSVTFAQIDFAGVWVTKKGRGSVAAASDITAAVGCGVYERFQHFGTPGLHNARRLSELPCCTQPHTSTLRCYCASLATRAVPHHGGTPVVSHALPQIISTWCTLPSLSHARSCKPKRRRSASRV
jgi:hypothetical protein